MPKLPAAALAQAFALATLFVMPDTLDAGEPPDQRLASYSEEIFVVGEGPAIAAVEPGEPVRLRFGAGELQVLAGDSPELRAEIEVRCPPARRALCGEAKRKLRVEPRRTTDGLELRMAGMRRQLLSRLQVSGTVVVPRDSPLDVKIGAGDVDIEAGDRDLTVRMMAGDLRIEGSRDQVALANARARFGDAAVHVDGRVHSRRKALVGARGQWSQEDGKGAQSIQARLRFGDARIVLEDVAPGGP
ncbi:MAG: hypothetical protein DWQ36_14945 [Acidobacteria bacterium]|nr:MAG: hypothetical protein DWQ30_00045 [Acidobacteriota bacterium]REK06188.1 MAG: hypothetical protein DWQ36_14945 [Acidobacteriota bacterium]